MVSGFSELHDEMVFETQILWPIQKSWNNIVKSALSSSSFREYWVISYIMKENWTTEGSKLIRVGLAKVKLLKHPQTKNHLYEGRAFLSIGDVV